jgi:SAM-dependent methyltransferase
MLKSFLRRSRGKPAENGGRVNVDRLSDDEFLDYIYRKFLGRAPDPEGRAHQLKFLRAGNSRASLVLNITEAPEFIFKVVKDNIHAYLELLPIKDERPDRFEILTDRRGKEKTWAFRVREGDFDWLERKVLGSTERPGVWSFIIDEDKRMLAEVAAEFGPRSVLDLGCANGAVLRCLLDKGIAGDGVEISRMALDKAFPEIRDRIHLGDLLNLGLPRRYDLILGLDIFEHFNPHRLPGYVAEVPSSRDGGISGQYPGLREGQVFGEIFPVDYREWDEDIEAGGCSGRFRRWLQLPQERHLICAATGWWMEQFEARGFRRQERLELALHEKYDAAMDKISPARRSYYVFAKGTAGSLEQETLSRIASGGPKG